MQRQTNKVKQIKKVIMQVYVVIFNSALDGDSEASVCGVYADKKDASKKMKELYDMLITDFSSQGDVVETEDEWFSMYVDGYYSRTHADVFMKCCDVE